MRAALVGLVVGLLLFALLIKAAFWMGGFTLFVYPALALVAIAALVTVGVQRARRRSDRAALAIMLACALPLLALPACWAIDHVLVDRAKAYCEALGSCADSRCPALAYQLAEEIPVLPGRAIPTLLERGYSVRYEPRFFDDPDEQRCQFPDTFPGRTFWSGTRRPGGAWSWEHLMD